MEANIRYLVCTADFAARETNVFDSDEMFSPMVERSHEIDNRTARERLFETEEEAVKFAEEYLAFRRDDDDRSKVDPWLAYLEIRKQTIELIHKVR